MAKKSRKAWNAGRGDSKWQELAELAVKESGEEPDFAYWGDLPLGGTWAMTFSQTRDSDLLEISNFEAVKEGLQERFPNDVVEERFSHWAVGWIDRLLVRMLRDDGVVTKAGAAALEWKKQLEEDYPVADETDYDDRVYDATIENIKSEGNLDDETTQDVYRWLSEHEEDELENVDAQGGYPSREAIDRALKALTAVGLEEDGDEPLEPRRYIDPLEQLRLWGRVV